MLTANQLHKQSQIDIEFQDFLAKMKESFGENFMDLVNAGKVKLQEIQSALGLAITPEQKPETTPKKATGDTLQARRAQRGSVAGHTQKVKKPQVKVKKVTKSASGDGFAPKCSSCEANKKKNATGSQSNALRNVLIFAGIGAVVFWAVKNRK